MGGCPCPGEATSNEFHHDVHVRKHAPNLQHYDGLDALPEPAQGIGKYGLHLPTL